MEQSELEQSLNEALRWLCQKYEVSAEVVLVIDPPMRPIKLEDGTDGFVDAELCACEGPERYTIYIYNTDDGLERVFHEFQHLLRRMHGLYPTGANGEPNHPVEAEIDRRAAEDFEEYQHSHTSTL